MDPDEVLRRVRALVKALGDSEDASDSLLLGVALVEAFEALDGWLSRGGFLPAAWKR